VTQIFSAQIGTPFSILTHMAHSNSPGDNGNFAKAVAAVKYLGGLGPDKLWFDPSSFAAPTPNTFGWWNYDSSIVRAFPTRERVKLKFRSEVNNFTNTPKWGNRGTIKVRRTRPPHLLCVGPTPDSVRCLRPVLKKTSGAGRSRPAGSLSALKPLSRRDKTESDYA
jgi:hypothetical protein